VDNIVGLKRKAQKLVQKGSYKEAIEHYVLIVESGEMDPYDFVVLGDLLLRIEKKDDAVGRYQQALDAYVEGGLYRNAIALCKRIKRLAPSRLDVQRQLGDLYAAEGLNTEAALHYIEFLERGRGGDKFAEACEEVCAKLLQFPLPTYDLVPRIVEIAREVERAEALAPGVMHQAQRAEKGGRSDQAQSLRELALSLDPSVEAMPEPEAAPVMDPGAVSLESTSSTAMDSAEPAANSAEPAADSGTPATEPEPVSMGDPGGISFEDGPGVVHLDDAAIPSTEEAPAVLEPGVIQLDGDPNSGSADDPASLDETVLETAPSPGDLSLDDGYESEPGVIDLDAALSADEAALSLSGTSQAGDTANDRGDDPAELRDRADRALSRGDSGLAQREYMRSARAYADQGMSSEASEIFQAVVKLDPNHLDALEAMVDIAWETKNLQQMVRFSCDLGDVLLARERYDEARVHYERVLEVDPDNQKAQTRVKRLRAMSGEDIPDVSHAVVVVKDSVSSPTQTSVDLAAILEEFKASIVDSIPSDDAQSHYDMGHAYKEMGLMDEAISEYHSASDNPDLRPQALEMLGECYLVQGRPEDALLVFEEVAETATAPDSQARIQLALGKTKEALGRSAEAEECYFRALELNDDLVEAAEHLHDMEQKRAGDAS